MSHGVDLKALSFKQLQELSHDVRAAMAQAEKDAKAETARRMAEVAREMGFSVEEIFSNMQTSPRSAGGVKEYVRSPPTHVYVNPNNKNEFYTNRGRKPAWFVELDPEIREEYKEEYDPARHGKPAR